MSLKTGKQRSIRFTEEGVNEAHRKGKVRFLAGIDEAGFGPVLGPLLVGAMHVSPSPSPEPAALWDALDGLVSRPARKTGKAILVGDSKQVTSRGFAALERGVLAFLPSSRIHKMRHLLKACHVDFHPVMLWERMLLDAPVPAVISRKDWQFDFRRVSARLRRTGWGRPWPNLKMVTPIDFNQYLRVYKNKHMLLLNEVFALFEGLPKSKGRIFVDRLGGRRYYLPLLRQAFQPPVTIETLTETPHLSTYCVTRNRHMLEISFQVKGDRSAFLTALASMYAKYLRERYMSAFNAFWCAQIPGLAPTAGYPEDSKRFLSAIEPKRGEISIDLRKIARLR